ncbi:hypothetical protein ACCO45_008636 [Purpureocillium lilacinum]|uniref:Uncharacterized protein n=1 Tax=Purpureocillium lilacinum TaxID=33203 RepID=A0ACC4DRY9_PURLI
MSVCQYSTSTAGKADERQDAGHNTDNDRDDYNDGYRQQDNEHDNDHENEGNDTATNASYSWMEQGFSPECLAISAMEGWSSMMGVGQEEFAVPLPPNETPVNLDHLPLSLSDISTDAAYTPSSASSSNDSAADARSCFSAPRGGCLQYPDQLPIASDIHSSPALTDSSWHDDGLFKPNFSGVDSPIYNHSSAERNRTFEQCSCLERLVLLLDEFEPPSACQGDQGAHAAPSTPTPATVEATFTALKEALGHVQSTTDCTACETKVDATTVLALLVLRLIKALRLLLPATLSAAVAAASPCLVEWRRAMCTAALDLARRLESLAQVMSKRALASHHRFLVQRLMTAQVQLAAYVQTLLLAIAAEYTKRFQTTGSLGRVGASQPSGPPEHGREVRGYNMSQSMMHNARLSH